MSLVDRISRAAPGLPALVRYRRDDLPHDLAAGVAVAAVAIPASLANAQLAGFSPVGGLYASVLPLVVYALFGTSRTLIVGPGAAVAAIIASAITPLAGGDEGRYLAMAMWLTFFTGALCVAASFLRLGALADFLSKPILVGFLNGVAISVVLSQVGVLFGLRIEATAIVPRAWEFVTRLPETHAPTLAIGALTIVVLVVAPRILRWLPGALAAMLIAGVAVQALDLAAAGVRTVGPVASGFPAPSVPSVPWSELPVLIAEAAGIALVMFSTSMVAARAFAERNRYEIDADREIAAFGAANIAAALSQSFVVQGTNSQSAVAEAAGARTQMTGIVAAAIVAVVVAVFTWPLQYIPRVSLAAVLVIATGSLFSWSNVATIRRISTREFWIAMSATVGVVAVGVMNAILVAVVLAIASYVQLAARPRAERLGTIPGEHGFYPLGANSAAAAPPGLVLFRFDGPIVFFSAAHFKREALKAAAVDPELKWFVVDLLPVNMIDATGAYTILEVFDVLRARGVVAGVAARDAAWVSRLGDPSAAERRIPCRVFVTLRQVIRAYRREVLHATPKADDG